MGGPKRKEEERPLSTAQGASSLIPSEGSNCFYSPDLTGSDFHFQQIGAYPRHAQRHARYPQASLGASIVPDGSGLDVDPWSIRGKSCTEEKAQLGPVGRSPALWPGSCPLSMELGVRPSLGLGL